MEIITVKKELRKPLKKIMDSQRQVKTGMLLLTREYDYLQKQLWQAIKEEYPEIGDRYAHLETKEWEITLFNKKGMKTVDEYAEDLVKEAKDIAEDLEARITKLEELELLGRKKEP